MRNKLESIRLILKGSNRALNILFPKNYIKKVKR